ncbi:MAG: (2Fe-2S)-binding protein, partial [Desulfobacteraceae bacterium]|nr:(2Fe-2S)-binding protein [Desulfobacteraceae bacterium]
DSKPVLSCLLLAIEAQERHILTIEGLSKDGDLHALQQAFIDHGALQCGFCTPGMLLSAKALLDDNPNPTEDEVKEAISGNLCRCTGYTDAVNAILDVAERKKEAK